MPVDDEEDRIKAEIVADIERRGGFEKLERRLTEEFVKTPGMTAAEAMAYLRGLRELPSR